MNFESGRALRAKLKSGAPCIGAWQTLGNAGISEVLAGTNVDWVMIDMEHSMLDLRDVAEAIRVVDLLGKVALVRPPELDAALIKRILDAGAHGIMIPNVISVQQAKDAVAATRYAPSGMRGVGLGRAQAYGNGFREQFDWAQEGALVIVQIEDKRAIAELDDIFSVAGIDAFFVGPYDLSCSLGSPGDFTTPEFAQAMDTLLAKGREMGLPAGYHVVEPNPADLQARVDMGYRMIAYGVDFRLMHRGMDDALALLT